MQNKAGVKVAVPMDRNSIRKQAYRIRKLLCLGVDTYIDIVKLLELMIPIVDPEFALIPLEDKMLTGQYAATKPDEHIVFVKQSVYEAAIRGSGWARMILAHEFGHYVLHNSQNVAFAKLDPAEYLPPDIDPERQADIFAAEFLAPSGAMKKMTPHDVEKKYGVSMAAAKNQLRQAGNIDRRQAKKKKKKRSSQKHDRRPT